MKFLKLLPLAGKRLEDLTLAELNDVREVMGVEVHVTDELKSAGLALLKGQNLDTVADLIQSPDSVKQLVAFIRGGVTAFASPTSIADEEGVNALVITVCRS